MGIFRTTDPTKWDDLDGIYISESAPPGAIKGAATGVVLLIGQFERGPSSIESVGSTGELFKKFGDNKNFSGHKALLNKKFGRLKVARVTASDAALATLNLDDGGAPTDILQIDALQGKGAYGNNLSVTVEAGSSIGKKYTFKDKNPNPQVPQEVYDNVVVTGSSQAQLDEVFGSSKLVKVTLLDNSAEPANLAETDLASGSDGTIADTDYEDAIQLGEAGSANIVILDAYNSTRNGYLKTHVANTQDRIAILCGAEGDSVSQAKTDVANYRDSDGRMIYAYPYVETVVSGVKEFQAPASWYASILSQTSPHIDPAYAENTKFLQGMTALKNNTLNRQNYIELKEAGISAFELDSDIGFKVKSGVTTHIANSEKTRVLRRRMADFLTNSIAKALKPFQNAPNTAVNRSDIKGLILDFIIRQENDGILPKDSEVSGGAAKLVDTESLNTDDILALGQFRILYKQRIHSAMESIVLQAEIGQGVVVTEAA